MVWEFDCRSSSKKKDKKCFLSIFLQTAPREDVSDRGKCLWRHTWLIT